MQTFDKFQSDKPFVTFSWETTALDSAFGDYPPHGEDNYVWLVCFDPKKFVKAGFQNAQTFIDLSTKAIADIKPAGELKIAPLSQYEVNQIWAGSNCGYEQENIRRHGKDFTLCNGRYEDRVKRMFGGESMNIQEMNASFQRGIGNIPSKFTSNKKAAQEFAKQINMLSGIKGLAKATEYVYRSSGGYDYGSECTC
jgi:hypothetical protein